MDFPVKVPSEILHQARSQNGASLWELSFDRPVLLVFLRHFGCTFCRETLSDIAAKREFLSEKRILPAFVHMVPEDQAGPEFTRYGVEDLPRFSDPEKRLYSVFGLKPARWRQLLGLKVWVRGFLSAIVNGHGFSGPKGDPMQMPGVFLLRRGQVLRAFEHTTPADRPNYSAFSNLDGPEG
jgi:hypothetical protein